MEPRTGGARPTCVRRRAWAATAAAAGALAVLAGCGGAPAPESSADYECVPRIRWQGVVYTGYGYTDREATRRLGEADQADCRDVGRETPVSDFPSNPDQVGVWTFAGHAGSRVLGVPFDEGAFSVFIAESVPRSRGQRILQELGGD